MYDHIRSLVLIRSFHFPTDSPLESSASKSPLCISGGCNFGASSSKLRIAKLVAILHGTFLRSAGRNVLPGTTISHLGKRKIEKIIDSKVPAGRDYVSSQEGMLWRCCWWWKAWISFWIITKELTTLIILIRYDILNQMPADAFWSYFLGTQNSIYDKTCIRQYQTSAPTQHWPNFHGGVGFPNLLCLAQPKTTSYNSNNSCQTLSLPQTTQLVQIRHLEMFQLFWTQLFLQISLEATIFGPPLVLFKASHKIDARPQG